MKNTGFFNSKSLLWLVFGLLFGMVLMGGVSSNPSQVIVGHWTRDNTYDYVVPTRTGDNVSVSQYFNFNLTNGSLGVGLRWSTDYGCIQRRNDSSGWVNLSSAVAGGGFSGSWNDLSDIPSGFDDDVDNDTTNPFNQDLNTSDNVEFNAVTATNFKGDGSMLTNLEWGDLVDVPDNLVGHWNRSGLTLFPAIDGDKLQVNNSVNCTGANVTGNVTVYENFTVEDGSAYFHGDVTEGVNAVTSEVRIGNHGVWDNPVVFFDDTLSEWGIDLLTASDTLRFFVPADVIMSLTTTQATIDVPLDVNGDLDIFNNELLNANLSSYAGDNITWDVANQEFDASVSGGSGGNPFDQDLNTSDNATFANVTVDSLNGINDFGLWHNNSGKLWYSGGDVGIGLSNPSYLLSLYDDSLANLRIESGGSNCALILLRNSEGESSIYEDGNTLRFSKAADEITIDNGNQVGIMDTSPSNTLDVNGGIDSDTLNTGFGDNELYEMDQNVLTTSDVVFNSITGDGSGLTGITAGEWVDDGSTLFTLDAHRKVQVNETVTASNVDVSNQVNISDVGHFSAGAALGGADDDLEITADNYLLISADNIFLDDDVHPAVDSSYQLGRTTLYWNDFFIHNITFDHDVMGDPTLWIQGIIADSMSNLSFGTDGTERLHIHKDGSITASGSMTANSFIGDGSGLTNLGIEGSKWNDDGTSLFTKTSGRKVVINNTLSLDDYKLLNANLADYAGDNITWDVANQEFDAAGAGGGGETVWTEDGSDIYYDAGAVMVTDTEFYDFDGYNDFKIQKFAEGWSAQMAIWHMNEEDAILDISCASDYDGTGEEDYDFRITNDFDHAWVNFEYQNPEGADPLLRFGDGLFYLKGEVGIKDGSPEAELEVEGDIVYSGSITDDSDSRIKQVVSGIPKGKIHRLYENLSFVMYRLFNVSEDNETGDFILGNLSDSYEMGLIAQEVYNVLASQGYNDSLISSFVRIGNDTRLWGLNYVGLSVLNGRMCQLLMDRVNSLEAEMEMNRLHIQHIESFLSQVSPYTPLPWE